MPAKVAQRGKVLPYRSVGEKLRAEKETAYLSRKLSVIVCDAPVKLDLEAAKLRAHDYGHLRELFRKLEFKSLMSKLPVLEAVEQVEASPAPGNENFAR